MRYSILIILIFSILGCKNLDEPIVRSSDYEKYMQLVATDSMHTLQRIVSDMDFWMKRLEKNPDDVVAKVSLAGLYGARFKTAGDINDIHTSDSLYMVANPLFKTNSSSIYRSLAANCITQHKFRQAQSYIDSALSMGDDLYLSLLMQCDIAMELGNLYVAQRSLDQIADKNNFDYLIREAKLLDHKGDLPGAVKKMEIARHKAIDSKKDALILWATSNLGDMYGHANRYKESYQCYLDVLKIKPDYLYALKGIAWLAFSHDKNEAEAKRILNYLSKLHPVPDYDLLLAKIAAHEKEDAMEEKLNDKFIAEVSDKRYGDMYNKYVFYLMTDKKNDFDKALTIARTEVNNRPTAQSYDLLAWINFKMGNKDEALSIAKRYVENKNFEPDALYHLGMIYADAGNITKAKHFIQEANSAAFELGPELATKISYDLKALEN